MNFSTSVDVKEKMIVIFHWEWSKYVLGFCFLLFQVYHTLFMYTSLRSCQWRTKSRSHSVYDFGCYQLSINTSRHAYFRISDNKWRYLESAKPPQKHKTPKEKATYFRDYDKNKQTRSYQSEWEQGRSWLKDTDNGMVCTICQENGDPSTNMFITGCTSYKLDSVSKYYRYL